MTMGQRIHEARLASGLSQRQLAGEEITRNMLSALEHDAANPSISTLKYLSEKLCKPISYFLEEDVPQIPEYPLLSQARDSYDAGDFQMCSAQLSRIEDSGYFAREISLLRVLALLGQAERAIGENRLPYARTLLEQAETARGECAYAGELLHYRISVLLACCPESESKLADLVRRIPEDDTLLLLKARAALTENRFEDARRYLAASDCRGDEWSLLMGELMFRTKQYREALPYYHQAEKNHQILCAQRLEICYRELEDYKMAYFYAKK